MNRTAFTPRVRRIEAILLPHPISEWTDPEPEAYILQETKVFAVEHGMTVEAARVVFEAEMVEILTQMAGRIMPDGLGVGE